MPPVIAYSLANLSTSIGMSASSNVKSVVTHIADFKNLFPVRNGPGSIVQKGIVVHLTDSSESSSGSVNCEERNVTVKYFETAYSQDRYDEICPQHNVFLSLDEADSGKGKRTRRAAVLEPQLVRTVAKSSSMPSAVRSSALTKAASRPQPHEDQPIEVPEPAPTPTPAPEFLLASSPVKAPVASKKRQKRGGNSVSAATTDVSSARFEMTPAHEFAAQLFPSIGDADSHGSRRNVDRCIKRGLLHAIYRLVQPASVIDNTGSGPHITAAQVTELLKVCPMRRAEMMDESLMPLCAPLLAVPLPATFCDLGEGEGEQPPSVGDSLLGVVTRYLAQRGFHADTPDWGIRAGAGGAGSVDSRDSEGSQDGHTSTDSLLALPPGLSIPLSFENFDIALALAFERLGGREAFEGRKGVRGLDWVTGGASCYVMLCSLPDYSPLLLFTRRTATR